MISKEGLIFGTAGIPQSSGSPSTQAGIERIRELGLDCMEVEFVQGVRMSRESALAVGKVAREKRVALSAHGPYFINLNAREPEKVAASRERVLQTARITSLLGGKDVVFHAAFYLGEEPRAVYLKVKREIEQILAQLRAGGHRVTLRPEVMGKATQFGTLEEVLDLSTEVEGVAPCLDFAHWHARTRKFNSYKEFLALLDQVESKLGAEGLRNLLVHVSGIEYGEKGERKHLVLRESDFQYRELLRALKERGARGAVICESPNLEEDALILQQTYNSL